MQYETKYNMKLNVRYETVTQCDMKPYRATQCNVKHSVIEYELDKATYDNCTLCTVDKIY